MTPEEWQRINELYHAVLERPADQRAEFLAQACTGADALRRQIELLLTAHERAGNFLATPAHEVSLVDPVPLPPGSSASFPKKIGNYTLLNRLGEGGMGEVYEAQQVGPIRRKVALKLVKWGMDTREVVARFETERQSLALMNHQNIAQIFDGGVTEQGRPYFVMEYVPGMRITEYCDAHCLTIRDRLQLFIQVCDGVQHAHQKGVLHRDIKPSNVLITVQDESAVPKIIDFGLAKAMDQTLSETTLHTKAGQVIGTPAYMSPEQVGGLDLDTRTDVYSLGVLLYELLAGALPFEVKLNSDLDLAVLRQKILEEEPSRPSARINAETAKLRLSNQGSIAKQLRADLDWITIRALEKDRARRYGSPSELGADIARYLKQEPVLASPPSQIYLILKFVRRHRFTVAAATTTLLALLLGAAAATIGLVRATQAEHAANQERDRAANEAETTKAVAAFLMDLFKISDPSEALGKTVTAREILDQGSEKIHKLEAQPVVQARLMTIMGAVYKNLGLFDRGEALAQVGLEKRRQWLGPENPEVAESLNQLGQVKFEKGDLTAAESLFREALGLRQRLFGGQNLQVSESLNDLAMTLARYETPEAVTEAERHYRQALAIRRSLLGNEKPEVAQSLNNFAVFLWRRGELKEAEQLLREAIPINRKLLGEEHPEVAAYTSNLALVLRDGQKYDEAEDLFRRTLEIERKILGEHHPIVANTVNNLANLFQRKGDYSKAEGLYREAIRLKRLTFSENHWEVATVKSLLGGCYLAAGRYRDAEPLLLESYPVIQSNFGKSHNRTLVALRRVIQLYTKWGKPQLAARYSALLPGGS